MQHSLGNFIYKKILLSSDRQHILSDNFVPLGGLKLSVCVWWLWLQVGTVLSYVNRALRQDL